MEDDNGFPSGSRSHGDGECGSLPVSPVRGMESVIATVSGYTGLERFNLIRFITQAGANYVGAMSKSTTHLVCWKFEGRKYNLANKYGTYVINHQWFEDCVKAGKRIPENPYIMQSGTEVGPFLCEVSANTCSKGDKHLTKMKGKVLCDISNISNFETFLESDLKCLDSGCSAWSDSNLLREAKELVSVRRSKRDIAAVGSSHLTRPACKGRRLVKKFASNASLSNSSASAGRVSLGSKKMSTSRRPEYKNGQIRAGEILDERMKEVGRNNEMNILVSLNEPNEFENNVVKNFDGGLEEVEGIFQTNISATTSDPTTSKSTCPQNECTHAKDWPNNYEGDSNSGSLEVEDLAKQVHRHPTSVELSCVICWTDFSSTRGILPCGHRFCYSCIQSWADQMASKRKPSTCPLCKAIFLSIRKVEDAACSDQKIFSQTVPCTSASEDIVMLPGEVSYAQLQASSSPVCFKCHNREPDDLLLSCHVCRRQTVHSFCLDPPVIPWTCVNCKELRMLLRTYAS